MDTDYSKYILSKKEKVRFLSASYVMAAAIFFLFYHSILISAVGGILPIFLSDSYSRYLAGQRRQLLLLQFKDMIYSISASTAAGRQMPQALAEALVNIRLIYDEDTPLVTELKCMCKNIIENRESDERLLINFAKRSGCEDIMNFVQVYVTCRKMGGDLEKVLKNTSEILMDKMTIKREIKALTAQKKLEGKVIAAMPILVIALLNIISPDYLSVLYNTGTGRIIMTVALGGIVVAYYLISKLTEIEV